MIITRDATHMSVVVKGDKSTALRAGHSRGIPMRFVRSTPHGESICIVEMQYRKDVMKWYAVAGPRLVPDGTPLLFTETYVAPYKTRD